MLLGRAHERQPDGVGGFPSPILLPFGDVRVDPGVQRYDAIWVARFASLEELAEGETGIFLFRLITAVEPVAGHFFLVVLAELRHDLGHDSAELLFAGLR